MIFRHFFSIASVVASAFLVACGGGGGGGGATTPAGITLTPALTTTNNSPLLWDAITASNLAEDGRNLYRNLATYAVSGFATQTGAGLNAACTVSGSTNVTYVDATSPGTVSAGDYWVYTYTNCETTAGTVSNGTITDRLTALNGNPAANLSAWTASITRTYATTSVRSGSGTAVTNIVSPHTITVGSNNSLSVTATPTTFSVAFTAQVGSSAANYSFTNFSGSVTYGGSIDSNTTYTKFGDFYLTGTEALANSGATYTLGVNYPVTLSGLYVGSGTHNDPTAGTFKMSGASSWSSLAAPFSTIILDTDNNGVIDFSAPATGFLAKLRP